jgi:hypothetical protein
MEIKNGSRWSGAEGRIFVVIGTMLVEGKEWVYYRTEKPVEHLPKEFSCYQESFLSRFTPLPE